MVAKRGVEGMGPAYQISNGMGGTGVGGQMGMPDWIRTRLAAACGVAVTIACGLGVRNGIGGGFGEHAGNVLWGVMWTLIVLGVVPRARVWVIVAWAIAIVFGIEY